MKNIDVNNKDFSPLIEYFEQAFYLFWENDAELIKWNNIEQTMVARIFLYLNKLIEESKDPFFKENKYYVDMEYARNRANNLSDNYTKTLKDEDGNVRFDIIIHSRGQIPYQEDLKINLDNLLHVEVKKDKWNRHNDSIIDNISEMTEVDKQEEVSINSHLSDCIRLSMTTKQPDKHEKIDLKTGLLRNILGYQYGIFLTGLKKNTKPEYRLFRDGKMIGVKSFNKQNIKFNSK